MQTGNNSFESAARTATEFASTHWSVVLSAGDSASPNSHEALERLCRTYWLPLYTFIRRKGYSPADAEDLVQDFFAAFLEKGCVGRADPARGRFRTFLLSSLQNFLHNAQDRLVALKRGGGQRHLSLDVAATEERYRVELQESMTPEKAFEKRWAATLLQEVLDRVREDFKRLGRAELFEQLKGHIWADDDAVPYAQLGMGLGMTPLALKVTVHRLRQRFGERLRDEIAHTMSEPGQVEDEIRYLMGLFGT
jgi:RNA polymerase sigma-70 factor (ECF subfamily)